MNDTEEQNANEVHPEAKRILKRYRTMTRREIRRAGSEWVDVDRYDAVCDACDAVDVHVFSYSAVKGPQPNTLLESGCCNTCGWQFEHYVADVPNTGCNPLEWTPKAAEAP